jgi:predicted nucleic acid-binding protein
MSILLDTNLLTRPIQPAHPHHTIAITALRELRARNERLCIVPQNLYEFWVVCTRPAGQDGFGLTTQEARTEQQVVLSLTSLLPDTVAILPEWQRLVTQYDVKGRAAHDARLVAAMIVHGVTRIITFNIRDFARYREIQIVDPQSVTSP